MTDDDLTRHEKLGVVRGPQSQDKAPGRKPLTPSPLDYCLSRKLITEAQHQAGRCHFQLFRRAGVDPKIKID